MSPRCPSNYILFRKIHAYIFCIYSFPPTKRKKWESIFPSCTKKDEINLVDSLIRYDPKKRLSAQEVVNKLNFSLHTTRSIKNKTFQALSHIIFF